jgi:tRNA-modifying protein YgfZ
MSEGLTALREDRATADLSSWRKVLVGGGDAFSWLNDLLTAELAGLEEGAARRSLLLSPTGRIRADVAVTPVPEGLLLLQDPVQPSPIDSLLARYVLSSDVELKDRSDELGLVAMPGGADGPLEGARTFRPSPLGSGLGATLSPDAVAEFRERSGPVTASPEALEAFRIELGVPRFGVDLGEDSLPHEAPLDHAVAQDKGCFLGQEAVAKVRNLGHPPFVVIAMASSEVLAAGDPVMAGDREAGRVTSAARLEDRTAALARIRWADREADLTSSEGVPHRRTDTRSGWESATG